MKRVLLQSILWATATAMASGLAIPKFGHAIDIVLVWDDLDENPDFDPNGTRLMAVADAAAQIWEQLIPSSGTHIVDVSWSVLDENTVGFWKFDLGNNNIYFDSDREWFIDPTPLVHNEFDFGSRFSYNGSNGSFLYGITAGASDWFDRTTPPVSLEIGYVGAAKETAPTAARDELDLLSVILHELGHELGVGGDELSGRYPIYPAHISGLRDVEVVELNLDNPNGETFGEEHGHVAPPMALMSPATNSGERTLPSATDVPVAARDSNYTTVDLPRKFVGHGTDWNSQSTWIGGRVPDSTDDAYMARGSTVTLSGTGRVENLFIGRGSTVATGANSLTVDNLLAFQSDDDSLRIDPGGSVTVGTVDATGGVVDMNGGLLNPVGAINGRVVGHGTINFGGEIEIGGRIEAAGGIIELTGAGSIKLQWIGGNSARLFANTGDLKLGLGFANGSDGGIDVFPGRRLIVTRDLTIPNNVRVALYGSPEQPASITSEGADTDVTISDLSVNYLGTGEIRSRTVTLNGQVHLEDGALLTLASPVRTTFEGASLDGNGTLRQEGDISVSSGTTLIDVSALEWGNSTPSQSNELRLTPNSMLHVTSQTISAFRGALTVDSATLQIDSPWQLASETAAAAGGSLTLLKSGAATPIVRGQPFVARNWIVTSGGDTSIESDLTVMSTATMLIFGGSRLFLDGNTTFHGGSISGLGDLVQSGDINVAANTTIATETFAWGNSFGLNRHTLSVQPLATLTVNSPGTGNPDNQFRGTMRLNGGTLVVNTDGPWVLPAQSLLQVGGLLELDGNVVTPHVQGQALTVEGRINVFGGPAHLDNDVVFLSTHQTEIATGATLHVNGATTYQGGAFTGGGTLQHNGTALLTTSNPLVAPHFVQNGRLTALNLSNLAAIQASTIKFQPGSLTRLFNNLRLRGAAEVYSHAAFQGSGTLIVDPTGSLTGGPDLAVSLANQGRVNPGFSAGKLNVTGDYRQEPLATLGIELAGSAAGAWDILAVSGAATLDGILYVSLLGGFTPALGNRFTVLSAGGGISGEFSQEILPSLPTGMTWSLEYDTNSLTLSTVAGLQGDIDGDRDVDRKDTAIFVTHLANGVATLADLHLLQSHFGQQLTTRGGAAASAAVPEPASWALASLGLVWAARLTATRRGARLRGANPAGARSPLGRG